LPALIRKSAKPCYYDKSLFWPFLFFRFCGIDVTQTTKTLFRKAALGSRLVSEEEMRQAILAVQQERNSKAFVDDKSLASKLVELEVISAYQADQLKSGRKKLNLGPYIITDWIGQGGMGQVFKAVHDVMARESAVKVLPLNKSTPEAIANFRREIRTQAKLDHPNLVRAYDAGEDGNVHYLVVEYVPGTDLRGLCRSRGRLSVQQAANIIMQAAMGLDYAHSRHLIHRDVKPGNILVTPDGVAKVSDLGLAGFLHDTTDPRMGKTVGTADYLSPEQIRTPTEVTALSDIYSLGCTLYYAVTGKVPFPGGTSRSKARRHLQETPWHPRRFNEEVSDEFVDLIADMMEKDPAARVQTAKEVATRLSAWASDNSPLVSDQMNQRARWMPAPLPDNEANEALLNIAETGSASFDVAELAMQDVGSASQMSASNQETRNSYDSTFPPPPPLTSEIVEAHPAQFPLTTIVLTALVVAPLGIALGAVLGWLARSIFS
jgi:serine/threonine protein kinase